VQTAVAGALSFADCMRSNGVTNYPDPSGNGGSHLTSNINPNSPTFLSAFRACQKDAPTGQVGPPAPSAAELRIALAFAQCMRKNGFPQFPDPLAMVPLQANLMLGRGMYFPINSTTNFQSPSAAFRQAAASCGVQLP
jgi:hypothetical protein